LGFKLSTDFWFSLILAAFIFVIALAFVNRSKIKTIRYFLADRLRRKITPKIKMILPIISNSLNRADSDLFPLFRLRADLEALCLKADILFYEERIVFTEFLTNLSSVLTIYKHNSVVHQSELDNVILSGQRVIVELSELGKHS